MTVTNLNTVRETDDEPMADHSMPQGELGWEGHVHVSDEIPLWKRVLDTWPELRTGLSYSLIFASGVCLGGAIMAIMATSKNNHRNS
jgi:hypothetical protein